MCHLVTDVVQCGRVQYDERYRDIFVAQAVDENSFFCAPLRAVLSAIVFCIATLLLADCSAEAVIRS